MTKRPILVTGASGFVGTVLCECLQQRGWPVRRAGRPRADDGGREFFPIIEPGREVAWTDALNGAGAVIHLAARTHVHNDRSADPLAAYREVNVAMTSALARQAAASGVERLVFLSSIKVNGESTPNSPFAESDAPAPEDAYGISKWEAEQALLSIAKVTGLQTVILRPPLVYGPGVKGNFLRLFRAIDRGLPMPLASIRNQRSLVYVGNLVDAIIACLESPVSPVAPAKTYIVSDDTAVSTPQLVQMIARALSRPARLVPCPAAMLNLAAGLLGKRDAALRLTGSLRVDSTCIRHELGWRPTVSLAQGLALTAQWYDRLRHQAH